MKGQLTDSINDGTIKGNVILYASFITSLDLNQMDPMPFVLIQVKMLKKKIEKIIKWSWNPSLVIYTFPAHAVNGSRNLP